ncbi:MgtC/SapB family protein [Crenobacter intestini]|uniref:MgtC/SapB family protein n=1 Tax=Crenobacter intestini TaxID=2563443 RepID=A0A4T0UWG7_9NEIS|nr:MgtC/SapB family protein [Crenobacter intestini]TIC83191.1 MgtC/SapB family protein [Crenobacter intestini]
MGEWDFSAWLRFEGTPFAALPEFLTSIAIGLLIGVERERKADIAGIRTFALTALLGTLLAMLGTTFAAAWLPAVGLALAGALGFLPAPRESLREPRTTTQMALLICYGLGVLIWLGQTQLAIALGVITTLLLYLKRELSGMSHGLSRRDLLSIIQFCALTFVVLPLLPDARFGPYGAFNPYKVWLLVVLIVGVGLAGYLALKVLGSRYGAPLTGLMGGVVSSTATTLVFARQARERPASLPVAASVIVLANLVLFARLTLVAALVMPPALPTMARLMLPALALGLAGAAYTLWSAPKDGAARAELELQNPTQLKLALGFAAVFALVLLASAWLNELFGSKGVYVVALVTGVNDVDAITLALYQMLARAQISLNSLAVAAALAVLANTAFKFGIIASIGGPALARRCLPAFAGTVAGMLAGLAFA